MLIYFLNVDTPSRESFFEFEFRVESTLTTISAH